jgi:rhodanese-related sulfurtransferase
MDVEPERVAELHREGSIQLIDIREDYEWDAGRIAGARHLAVSEVAAQAETIHRETPVVFYCRVGGRSTMAANAFRRAGFDAYSMTGGMVAWAGLGLPLEPDDGYVADH